MKEQFPRILATLCKTDFWIAFGTVAAAIVPIVSLILNNQISKTTMILIDSINEVFIKWTENHTKSKKIDNDNLEIWIREHDGDLMTGRKYLIYKKLVKRLRKKGHHQVTLMEKDVYKRWITKNHSTDNWIKEW